MATTDDYGQGVSIASLADQPDAETLARNIANAIVSRSVMRFASASTRTASLAGTSAPVEGMVSWLQDVNRFDIYNGSSWVPVTPQKLGAVELITFTTRTTFTLPVTFSSAFSSAPGVHTNINSGSGPTSQWHSRAIDVTNTGFTLFVYSLQSAAWTNVPVRWDAAL
ncbi:H-type lectin domain-containing protein [Streptomyces anulatus]|uniref:H-type lectin domain-containing protein n=1 Tax=Streptomyces anulatus TaxID=1892 RepID=UPI00224F98D7|nr:H-type lectin domain-containing protein [Streptomyces anulatus]MCX4605520.1 H-type lectin domain-containing protein [Streptomyces anulatus]